MEEMNISQSKKTLFRSAMKNDWDKILDICGKNPKAHTVQITRTGDTLLHLAVADGKEEVVRQLVKLITKPGNEAIKSKALGILNERKNTPLHLAASLGNVKMCNCIAGAEPDLIGYRNVDGETPFFLAALHGKLDAFLCLDIICKQKGKNGLSHARRNDGESVLHSAIHGDYFELAFIIIQLYGNLVDYRSEEGISPLHLLASKPSAFKSGGRMGWFDCIIYHCIFVEEMKKEAKEYQPKLLTSISGETSSIPNYPENYTTCVSFFQLIYSIFHVLVSREKDEQNNKPPDAENPVGQQGLDEHEENKPKSGAQGHELFPPNYRTCYEAIKLIYKAMLIILGLGSRRIVKLREKKEKHTRAVQIMNELIETTVIYEHEDSGGNPGPGVLPIPEEDETTPYILGEGGSEIMGPSDIWTEDVAFPQPTDPKNPDSQSNQNDGDINKDKNRQEGPIKGNTVETPLLIAARHGVKEMVEKILDKFPVAIYDTNSDRKNIVLVAVENRQPHIYQLLLERNTMKDTVFGKVDKDGNSALHLAATLGTYRPWLIPGAALQMQWEIKWYEFVKSSMPPHFFVRYNKRGETPKDVFTRSHNELVKDGGKWLTKTSESCSVVAALIATVAFATSTTVPGGIDEKKGTPNLENEPAFDVFAISSLVALCVSVTALVMFLAILTSRYQERDFHNDLPRKLLTGLSSLFISIASMLVSFCAGHFFVLKDKLKYAVYPVYAVTCLPITFFAVAQFPLYFDLIRATFKKVPQRSYKLVPLSIEETAIDSWLIAQVVKTPPYIRKELSGLNPQTIIPIPST
ncbi:hypothetical protein LguiB_000288 [Lonicera macranthoides]